MYSVSWTRRFCTLFTILSILTLSNAASAEPVFLDNGLMVVIDPVEQTRGIQQEPGSSFTAYVLLSRTSVYGSTAIQYKLEIDPRLTLVESAFAPEVTIALDVGTHEWVLGFMNCIDQFASPFVVATLKLRVEPAATYPLDMKVGLGDLVDYGEPMQTVRCLDRSYIEPLVSMGGITVNGSIEGPSIPVFVASSDVVVEGRDYSLVWSTISSGRTTLDGSLVAEYGAETRTAIGTIEHVLLAESTIDASTTEARITVDVIRTPVVRSFTAELREDLTPPQVRLKWYVVGATSIRVDGSSVSSPYGNATVLLNEMGVFELFVSNEWGQEFALAELGDLSQMPPLVSTFEAAPRSYAPGSPVTLSWRLFNADSAIIDNGVGSIDAFAGSTEVWPTGATTYTLDAFNSFGSRSATFDVMPSAPVIDHYLILPTLILQGGETTAEWLVRGADTLVLEPGGISLDPDQGSVPLYPRESTTYSLVATNSVGTTTADLQVIVAKPAIYSFKHNSTFPIYPGAAIVLEWDAAPSMDLRIDPDVGPLNRSEGKVTILTSGESAVYTLTASTPDTVITATTKPLQFRAPSLYLSAQPTRFPVGGSTRLTVSIYGAMSLRIDPEPGPVGPWGAIYTLFPRVPTTYTATATNVAGSVSKSVFVNVLGGIPPSTLVAIPNNPYADQPFVLLYTIESATEASIEPLVGAIEPTSGALTLAVADTTTFVLRSASTLGWFESSAVVMPRKPDVSLQVQGRVFSGGIANLEVEVAGSDSVSLEPGFGQIPGSGVYTIAVEDTTTFELTAVNSLGASSTSLTVRPQAPEVSAFTAQPDRLVGAGQTRLSWDVLGAEVIDIRGDDGQEFLGVDDSGFLDLTVDTTTTFSLQASNSAGEANRSVIVEVVPIWIDSFSADHSVVQSGDEVVLQWVVAGTGDVELVGYGTQLPHTGEQTVMLETTTNFLLKATVDGVLVDSRSLTVVVEGDDARFLAWSWAPDRIDDVSHSVPLATPFYAWVHAVEPTGGIKAFEFRALIPPELVLLGVEYFAPGAINVAETPDYIVGVGECLENAALVPLMKFQFMNLSFAFELHYGFTGTVPSSLPSGGPAYADCDDVVRPFQIGPAIQSSVPVFSVELQAARTSQGVALSWSVADERCADQVHVLRRSGDADPVLVATVRGADACGSWIDDSLEALESDLHYSVALETERGTLLSREVALSDAPVVPVDLRRATLLPNRPNPFNPRTTLRWVLPRSQSVVLDLFDMAGRRVRHFDLGRQPIGEGVVDWDGRDDLGRSVSSGVYVVRCDSDGAIDTQRILLLK